MLLCDISVFSRENAVLTNALAKAKTHCHLLHCSRDSWNSWKEANPTIADKAWALMVEPSEYLGQLSFFKGIPIRTLSLLGLMLKTVCLQEHEVLFEELTNGHIHI